MIFGPDRPAGKVGDRDVANVDWVWGADGIHPSTRSSEKILKIKKQNNSLSSKAHRLAAACFVKYSCRHFGIKVCAGIEEVCDSAVCGGSGSVDGFHPFGTGVYVCRVCLGKGLTPWLVCKVGELQPCY